MFLDEPHFGTNKIFIFVRVEKHWQDCFSCKRKCRLKKDRILITTGNTTSQTKFYKKDKGSRNKVMLCQNCQGNVE